MNRPTLLLLTLCAGCAPFEAPRVEAETTTPDAGPVDGGTCLFDGLASECPSPDGGFCVVVPLGDGGLQSSCDGEVGSVCLSDRACRGGGACAFTPGRWSACTAPPQCLAGAGAECGDGGVCVTVVFASGVAVTCTHGLGGEPCSVGSQCKSNVCEVMVTAVGVTRSCQ